MSLKTFLALALLTGVAAAAPDHTDPKGEAEKVATFTGTLRTGIVAIGGETTGVMIETAKGSYELDIQDKAQLASLDKLADKKITVTGVLTIKKGVEIKERQIIVVRTLAAAK